MCQAPFRTIYKTLEAIVHVNAYFKKNYKIKYIDKLFKVIHKCFVPFK